MHRLTDKNLSGYYQYNGLLVGVFWGIRKSILLRTSVKSECKSVIELGGY